MVERRELVERCRLEDPRVEREPQWQAFAAGELLRKSALEGARLREDEAEHVRSPQSAEGGGQAAEARAGDEGAGWVVGEREVFVRPGKQLIDELLPWAHEHLSFADDPARTLVAGSSLGGLAAAFCGLRRPDVFGLVLSQSGSFQRGLPQEFARSERLPLRFALDAGILETTAFDQFASLYHANLHMRDVLVAKGYDVSFRAF